MSGLLISAADVEVGVCVQHERRAPHSELVRAAAGGARQRAAGRRLRAEHTEVQSTSHADYCYGETTLEGSTVNGVDK